MNHKAAALAARNMVTGLPGDADVFLATGQLHATLYLAEQQRVANLLTAWGMYGTERTFGWPQKDDDLPHSIRSLLYPDDDIDLPYPPGFEGWTASKKDAVERYRDFLRGVL